MVLVLLLGFQGFADIVKEVEDFFPEGGPSTMTKNASSGNCFWLLTMNKNASSGSFFVIVFVFVVLLEFDFQFRRRWSGHSGCRVCGIRGNLQQLHGEGLLGACSCSSRTLVLAATQAEWIIGWFWFMFVVVVVVFFITTRDNKKNFTRSTNQNCMNLYSHEMRMFSLKFYAQSYVLFVEARNKWRR